MTPLYTLVDCRSGYVWTEATPRPHVGRISLEPGFARHVAEMAVSWLTFYGLANAIMRLL